MATRLFRCVITGNEIKIHIFKTRQEKFKLFFFFFLLLFQASSLPSSVHCTSELCINKTSPMAEIPAQL